MLIEHSGRSPTFDVSTRIAPGTAIPTAHPAEAQTDGSCRLPLPQAQSAQCRVR